MTYTPKSGHLKSCKYGKWNSNQCHQTVPISMNNPWSIGKSSTTGPSEEKSEESKQFWGPSPKGRVATGIAWNPTSRVPRPSFQNPWEMVGIGELPWFFLVVWGGCRWRILMVPAIIIPKYGKINIWGWVNVFLSPVEPWHHRLEWINMINV